MCWAARPPAACQSRSGLPLRLQRPPPQSDSIDCMARVTFAFSAMCPTQMCTSWHTCDEYGRSIAPNESRPAWTSDISRPGSAPRMALSTRIAVRCTASSEFAARQETASHFPHSRAEEHAQARIHQDAVASARKSGGLTHRLTCCRLLCISTGSCICTRHLGWQLRRRCRPCYKVAVQERAALWRGSEDLPTERNCRNLQLCRARQCIPAAQQLLTALLGKAVMY